MTSSLPTDYQTYIALSRYARWRDDLGRRESWPETVKRYCAHVEKWVCDKYPDNPKTVKAVMDEIPEIYDSIVNLRVMPSMRALMTAGLAAERDNVATFNCAFLTVDDIRSFDEIMYVLLCGTGVGFSVEKKYIDKLPVIAEEFFPTDTVIKVADSKIGWASAFRELVALLYAGKVPAFDVSRVRPSGERLKTFGGRASGPQPLLDLFEFCIGLFKAAKGRRLKDVECHDVVCKIASVIVVGGVRRAALISLSDLDSYEMRHCKSGQWWELHPHRALANNSAVYVNYPEMGEFLEEWLSLYRSGSGERGIFNRWSVQKSGNGRRDKSVVLGSNPCCEIELRSNQFCNLTSAMVRPDDDLDSLGRKVRVAAILGTIQSCWTDFRYLRKVWKNNCEEERLLGVSMTGICDNALMSTPSGELGDTLDCLKSVAIETNRKWADILGVNQSTAITCVKPEGTVSQLTNSASGIHPRYSEYYIRTVRNDAKDPLSQMMIDAGFPCEPELFKPESTVVFSFPIKSPKNCVMRDDMTAVDQLKLWMIYKKHWAEHTVSITVYVRPHEWIEVADYVYKNFSDITGVSFLPHTDHVYKQAPYQEITESQYNELLDKMPKNVDWSKLSEYEKEDATTGSQELACVGGVCEL